jgi:hypothetical protein
MKYTTDLREHNGKWYSRIEFTEIDTIPAGCRYTCDTISERKTLYDFNCRSGEVFARDFMSFLGQVYAPVDAPGGYPEVYEVIDCGDTIGFKKKSKPIIPAKFDWRKIEEYDLPDTTYVLLKNDDYYAVFVGYRKDSMWFDFDCNIVDPTHFTTFEA